MEIVILLLPAIVCFIVASIVWTGHHLTLSSRLLGWTMIICGFYLFLSILTTFPYTDPTWVVGCSIGLGLMVPMVQVAVIMLCWSLHTQHQRFNNTLWLFCLFPVLSGFMMMIGYGLIGIEAASDYIDNGRMLPPGLTPGELMMYNAFQLITVDIYRIVVIMSVTGCVAYLVYLLIKSDFTIGALFRFLFKRGPLRPLHLFILIYFAFTVLSMLRLPGDRVFVRDHISYYCLLFVGQAIVLALLALLALRFQRPCIYLVRPHSLPYFDDMPVRISVLNEKKGVLNFADDESDTYRTLNLRDELRLIMREKVSYLSPGMSRYSVSHCLDITRSGLDRLIHLLYHVSYEEYVMIQRTEYYRRYRLRYPEESQECVAMACGFPNVREMNRQIRSCRAFFLPIPEDVVSN